MLFGPFNLEFPGSLTIKNLNLEINTDTTQFLGKNGVGKSVILNLIQTQLIDQKIDFAKVDQDYRKNWLWWQTPMQNLVSSLKRKNSKFSKQNFWQIPEIEVEKKWLEPLLQKPVKQLQLNQDLEFNTNFSGGQLQRLILFRELLHKPKFLLLDEAFSALDKEIATEIVDWLNQKQSIQKFKIIAINHSPELVKKMAGQKLNFSLDNNYQLKIN